MRAGRGGLIMFIMVLAAVLATPISICIEPWVRSHGSIADFFIELGAITHTFSGPADIDPSTEEHLQISLFFVLTGILTLLLLPFYGFFKKLLHIEESE